MNKFQLQIVTYNKLVFDDEVENVIARTISGDVGILNNHSDYISPLKKGIVKIKKDNDFILGECDRGIISIINNRVSIITDSFNWV